MINKAVGSGVCILRALNSKEINTQLEYGPGDSLQTPITSGVPVNAQLSHRKAGVVFEKRVATKEHKRQANGLIKGLETRVHAGPPIAVGEITSAREFLRESEFSPSSDYYNRLTEIQSRLATRQASTTLPAGKRNYGGDAAGRWMQLQSAYDHVILSICYDGEFNGNQGRIKISHRFNQQGRIDFVELKFLRSLHPLLNGAIRKLITLKGYQHLPRDWREAEAFVLEVLPRELIFLYEGVFKCERSELISWLINIGHGLVDDLLKDLRIRQPNGWVPNNNRNPDQLCLLAVRDDEVALPILQKAASLQSLVEIIDGKNVIIRYHGG